MRSTLAISLFAVLAVTGCKKTDHGPACPAVVDHMLDVMKHGLTGHDSLSLGNRDQMIQQCEQRKMTAAERTCLANAKSLGDLASCRPQKAPVVPAPAGSGSGG